MSQASALLQILSASTPSAQGSAAPAQEGDAAGLFTGLVQQMMAPQAGMDAAVPAETTQLPVVNPAVVPPVALAAQVIAPEAGPDAEPPVDTAAPETTADAQLTAQIQAILVPPAAPDATPAPQPQTARADPAPARPMLPHMPAPATKPEDALAETPAPKADLDSVKTELSALKTDLPEAVKPVPAEVPRQAAAPAFSIQPVAAEATATPYAPVNTVAAQASALSHAAVEQLTQISVAIQKRLSEGTTRFQLELKPADLGRIDVALTITAQGKVNAHLEFDSPITATTFAVRESELRQQLTAAGLKIDGDALTFSSRPAESNQNQTTQAAQSQTGAHTAFADQQTGQQARPNPRQAARALKQADRNAAEADLDAALAQLRQRPGSGRLALDLTV